MALPELTLGDYLARVPPQNQHELDYKIENDAELAEIAESYTDWQGTIPKLGLKATDEEDILTANRSARVQRRVVLQRWRERYGYRATYRSLALCFYEAHRPDMVQAVLERLGASFRTDDTVKTTASIIGHQTTSQSSQRFELQHGLHDGTRPSQPPTTIPCGTTESLATKSGAVPAPRQQEPEPTKHPRQTASAGRHSHPSDKVFVKFPVSAEETYLGIEDLRYVVRVLHLLAHKWNNIGTVLRVRNLDTIRKKFPTDPERCLIAMLSDWLNGQYDTQRAKPPSWRTVVYALADRGGGDHRQRAEYVAKNHKALTQIKLDENVDARPLVTADSDEQDMEDAVRTMASELYAVAQRWYQIGLQLGVEVHRLEEIHGSDQECLETMLKTGIETDPDSMTWQSIVEVVRHTAGGNNSVIADNIAAKYSIQAMNIQ